MFLFHAAFSLGMIALTGGTSLYVWSARDGGAGAGFAKLIGTLVIIFSITSILCTSYYGVRYWWEGYFKNSMSMHEMMQNKPMMNDGMSNKMMGKQTEPSQNP